MGIMTLEVVPCFMLYAGAWDLAFWMGAGGGVDQREERCQEGSINIMKNVQQC